MRLPFSSMTRRHTLRRARAIPSWSRWAWLVLTGTAWSAVALRESALRHPELFEDENAPPRRFANSYEPPPKGVVKQLKAAVADGFSHDIPRRGASLAYYSVFSMAPLVLIMIAVVGFFLGDEAAEGAVVGQMQGFLGGDKAKVIQDMVAAAGKPGASAASGIIGVLVLLLGASAVVGELQTSLNAIWGVPADKASGIGNTVRSRLISMAFVLGMGFLLLVSLFMSTGAAAAGKFLGSSIGVPEAVIQGINSLLSLGVITVMFAAMFKFLPKTPIRWKEVWGGAFATAILFTIGNALLGLYLGKAGPASTYGAAGSMLTILLWTYYCAQLLYFGAEFTRVRSGRGTQPLSATMPAEQKSRALAHAKHG